MDFCARSNACLNRVVDHIGSLDNKSDVRKYSDVYQHLLKAQRVALESGCSPDAVDRFEREWAVCETCLGGGSVAPDGVAGESGPSEEQLEEFRRRVAAWFVLDDEERAARRRGAERRMLKKGLSDSIREFMTRHGIDNLETRDGCLASYEREVKSSPNRATQMQRIKEYFAERGEDDGAFRTMVFEAGRVTRSGLRRVAGRPAG